MKKTVVIFLLSFLFNVETANARVRGLSLSFDPSEFQAHQRLQFDSRAFNKRWLEKEVACHFEENKKGCRNLAALLRMYVEAVSDNRKLKAYAYKIKEQLQYDESKSDEIAWFLYLYTDDRSLVHSLDEYYLASLRENQTKHVLDAKDINRLLRSVDEAVVEQTLATLLLHPANVQMADEVFEQVVQVIGNESFSRATQRNAFNYLSDMGFYVNYGHDEQGKFELGKITVHSGPACLTEYLAANPISKVWKYYVNQLSPNGAGVHRDNDIEMVSILEDLSSGNDPDYKEKIAYIKKTKTYKNAKPSMKFIVGDYFMARRKHKLGLPILKEAYKQGNNAMKSSIVAKFNEHFPVEIIYWDELMQNSSAAEQVMIEINRKQWNINMARID